MWSTKPTREPVESTTVGGGRSERIQNYRLRLYFRTLYLKIKSTVLLIKLEVSYFIFPWKSNCLTTKCLFLKKLSAILFLFMEGKVFARENVSLSVCLTHQKEPFLSRCREADFRCQTEWPWEIKPRESEAELSCARNPIDHPEIDESQLSENSILKGDLVR